MPLIGVEAGAASAVAWSASAIVGAYLADRLGFTLAPFAILALSLAAAIAVFLRLRRETVASGDAASTAFSLIVTGTFAWLMWRARPDFLPTGTGSDLAHHLALLNYIEQHHALVHGVAAGPYLGEMIDYTPGAHLLAVMAGAWVRRDALHVVHGVVSLTAALKSGLVFLIARRLMPDGVPRVPFAIAAALLLWLPYVFFAGSFMEQSFLSQAVSELFAVAMWWTIVEWQDRPSMRGMALFALFGSAAFLTWPIWIGPLVLTLALVVVSRGWADTQVRPYNTLAIALVPIAFVTALYAAGREVYGFRMVNAVGFAVWPTPRTLGWPFIVLAASGIAWAARDCRARGAALLFACIVLQATALIATGLNSGATAPYLTLKMTYLAIYPLAVAGAVMSAGAWRAAVPAAAAVRYAWLPVTIVALAAGRSLASAPPVTPVVTQPLVLAGEWARAHVEPACVDYLVADGYSGYWLHLAVLGNPRAVGRALDNDTFDPQKAIVRWILPNGLPFAIAGNFGALPRDIRTNVDILARFGPAAVVKRRGAAVCADK
jgi:hypothetical protein